MKRRNEKDLKRRVAQARKVRLDENSPGMYISSRGELSVRHWSEATKGDLARARMVSPRRD